MDIAKAISKFVVQMLNVAQCFDEGTVIAAYDSNIEPTNIDKGVVSVKISELEIGEHNASVNDAGEVVVTNDRTVKANIKITFFVPYRAGSIKAYSMFDKAANSILPYSGSLKFLKAKCGEAQYRRENEALVVESVFTAQMNISL